MLTKKIAELPYMNSFADIFERTEDRITTDKNSKILGCNVIIPHVCNNVNGFGAGFAGAVADRYPLVKQNFHMLGNDAALGYVQFVTDKQDPIYRNKLIFANMIAQNGLVGKTNARPLKYHALVACMSKVKKFADDLAKGEEGNGVEIHAPKFGSGLAGGNWNFITDLIEDIWGQFNVTIYSQK